MILVGRYDSPFVRRVGISLNALGLAYEPKPLSVFGNASEMRTINPLGRVPALVLDDGEVLVDSAAILDHLDEVAGPDRALIPPAGPARRKALFTIALATGCSDKAIARAYEKRRAAGRFDPDWLERCHVQLQAGLAALEAMNLAAPAGRVSQVHISVATMLAYVGLREPETLGRGRYPSLESLAAACEAMDIFTRCPLPPN